MEINAAAAWLNSTFGNLDVSVALAVHKLYDMAGGFFTPFFEVISFFGKGGICLIFLSLALVFFKKTLHAVKLIIIYRLTSGTCCQKM